MDSSKNQLFNQSYSKFLIQIKILFWLMHLSILVTKYKVILIQLLVSKSSHLEVTWERKERRRLCLAHFYLFLTGAQKLGALCKSLTRVKYDIFSLNFKKKKCNISFNLVLERITIIYSYIWISSRFINKVKFGLKENEWEKEKEKIRWKLVFVLYWFTYRVND